MEYNSEENYSPFDQSVREHEFPMEHEPKVERGKGLQAVPGFHVSATKVVDAPGSLRKLL